MPSRGAVKERPQTELASGGITLGGGAVINDADLERQLVDRQRRKETLARYRKAYKETDDAVKARIRTLGVQGSVRCGGFQITVAETAGRAVSFETQPSTRIRIAAVKEKA